VTKGVTKGATQGKKGSASKPGAKKAGATSTAAATSRPPDPALLPAWLTADVALSKQDGAAIEQAAAGLPPRLAVLLRCLAAIDLGEADGVAEAARAARAAGQCDIAAVLDVLLADAETLDPTAVRKAAKAAALHADTQVAFLDLLRAFAARRTGSKSPMSAELREARRHNYALEAAAWLFTQHISQIDVRVGLGLRLPRAGQLFPLAQAAILGKEIDATAWRERFPVDLVHGGISAPPPTADHHAQQLHRRLTGQTPWDDAHDPSSTWLYEAPASERRAWLGPILRAIQVRLPAPSGDLSNFVHAAWHLAKEEPQLRDLATQLTLLEDRLKWLQDPGEPELRLLEELWRARESSLLPEERLHLAGLLWPILDEVEDERTRRSVAEVIIATTPDPEKAILAVGYAADGVRADVLLQNLKRRGAAEQRVQSVAAELAMRLSDGRGIIQAALALLRLGDFPGSFVAVRRARLARLRIDTGQLGLLASAASALHTEGAAELLSEALYIAPKDVQLRSMARRWVEGAPPELRRHAMRLAAGLGERSLLDPLATLEGRELRKGGAEVEQRAASTVGLLCDFLEPSPLMLETAAPFGRFLLRQGEAAALAWLERLPGAQPAADGYLAWWLARYSDVTDRPAMVKAALRYLMKDDVPADLARDAQILLERGARRVKDITMLIDRYYDGYDEDYD
jgi:hypothetical protein